MKQSIKFEIEKNSQISTLNIERMLHLKNPFNCWVLKINFRLSFEKNISFLRKNLSNLFSSICVKQSFSLTKRKREKEALINSFIISDFHYCFRYGIILSVGRDTVENPRKIQITMFAVTQIYEKNQKKLQWKQKD